MASIILFEDFGFADLLPLTYWRSVFELLVGRRILLDRTAQILGKPVAGIWTRDWIAKVAEQRCGAPANRPISEGTVLVNGRWVFDDPVGFPAPPGIGVVGDQIAYVVCNATLAGELKPQDFLDSSHLEWALRGVPRVSTIGRMIRYPWDVIAHLGDLLRADWSRSDAAIESPLQNRNDPGHNDSLHVGERAVIHPSSVLDPSEGPIFISHDVRIGPFAVIEGPAYLGPGSIVRPHAWLHGGVAAGPMSKLGGEIDACVIHGCTNKQHHGFLGHSIVGSWVNVGAGSSNSDLKNTYGKIRVPIRGTDKDSGQMFFGAVIGDHAKLGIHSAVPTGSVLGFAANSATTRLLPKFVPSFGWVTDHGVTPGDSDRLLDIAARVMARRNLDMTDDEVELFLDLPERARTFEHK